jgi:hypothetical protein
MNLAIVAAGISLMQVGAFNITMEYTPLQFSGVSLGMSVVLVLNPPSLIIIQNLLESAFFNYITYLFVYLYPDHLLTEITPENKNSLPLTDVFKAGATILSIVGQ